MAFAEESPSQKTNNPFAAGGVDSLAGAFPNNVTAGRLLVVIGAFNEVLSTSVATVTDTRSTVYTVVHSQAVARGGVFMRTFVAWGIALSSGACTVTVNPSGSSAELSFSLDAFTFTGTVAQDVDGGSDTGVSNTASDSITTAVANTLLFGVMTHGGSIRTLTPNDGTQIGESEVNSSSQCHNAIFLLAATAQAYTIDWTISDTSTTWIAQTLSLKEVAVAGMGALYALVPKNIGVQMNTTGGARIQ